MIDGIEHLFKAVFWIMAVSVPLALWKVVEILVWAASHISISFQ